MVMHNFMERGARFASGDYMKQVSGQENSRGSRKAGTPSEVRKVPAAVSSKERPMRLTDEVEVVDTRGREDLSPKEEKQLTDQAMREYLAQEEKRGGTPEAIRATMAKLRAGLLDRFKKGLNQLTLSPREFFRFIQDMDQLRELGEAAEAPINTKDFHFGKVMAEVERTLAMYPGLRRDIEALKKQELKAASGKRSPTEVRGMPAEALEHRPEVQAKRSADEKRRETAARIGPLIEETLRELEADDQYPDLPAAKGPAHAARSASGRRPGRRNTEQGAREAA